MKIRRVAREWHSIERMPTVPFNSDEIVDEKRETTGELTLLTTEGFAATISAKPEAIVRPLRRREPSDDDNPPPDLQDLEAQIIDKLTQLEKPHKAQNRDLVKDSDKKSHRWNQSRDSKKSSRDVRFLLIYVFVSMSCQ